VFGQQGQQLANDRAKDRRGALMAAPLARHVTSRPQIQQLAGTAVYMKACYHR
jgi:hypothetical protein